jgi:hypothetical protein
MTEGMTPVEGAGMARLASIYCEQGLHVAAEQSQKK